MAWTDSEANRPLQVGIMLYSYKEFDRSDNSLLPNVI